MVQIGITYEVEGTKYTVLDIGDESGEDGPNIVLRRESYGYQRVNVVKSLRQVVREIASTLEEI